MPDTMMPRMLTKQYSDDLLRAILCANKKSRNALHHKACQRLGVKVLEQRLRFTLKQKLISWKEEHARLLLQQCQQQQQAIQHLTPHAQQNGLAIPQSGVVASF